MLRCVGRGGDMPLRLALVDEHRLPREALRALLGAAADDLDVVTEASSSREASALLGERRADVVILDGALADAAELAVELKHKRAGRVLLLLDRCDEEAAARAFADGAVGCLGRDQAGAALVDAIRTVARGE